MVKSGNGKLSYRALREYSRMRNTLFYFNKKYFNIKYKINAHGERARYACVILH